MTCLNARSNSFGSSLAPTSRAIATKRLWRSESVIQSQSLLGGQKMPLHRRDTCVQILARCVLHGEAFPNCVVAG